MLFAKDPTGTLVSVTETSYRATCPGCGGEVTAVRPGLKADHWRHLSIRECDTWYDPAEMTEWHKAWQEKVPPEQREWFIAADGVSHRADIRSLDNQVVEVQHSRIGWRKIAEREQFYGSHAKDMIWIWDVSEFMNGRLIIRKPNDWELPDSFREFVWGSWAAVGSCRRRVFLDFGEEWLLRVGGMDQRAVKGWGYLIHKAVVVKWINEGPPIENLEDPREGLKAERLKRWREQQHQRELQAQRDEVDAAAVLQRRRAEQEAEMQRRLAEREAERQRTEPERVAQEKQRAEQLQQEAERVEAERFVAEQWNRDNPCCGEHHTGVQGEPVILACQLCPKSPTYWRLSYARS